MLIGGCSTQRTSTEEKQDTYIEDIEEKMEQNKEAIEKSVSEASEKLDNRLESIYNDAMNRYMEPNDGDGQKQDYLVKILSELYNTYKMFCYASPYIIVSSFSIGVIGALFSRKNKSARRFFIVTFIIAIPLLDILIWYGVGLLNGMVLHD